MRKALKEKIKSLPQRPGVYFFKDKEGKVIYIGKAKDLKKRVLSHFSKKSDWFLDFSDKIYDLEVIETENENEALILENEFIKRLQPRYNIAFKDDKNYFFVGFSQETWPRVFLTHQPKTKAEFLGPFVSGRKLKSYLSNLRKIFPFKSCSNFPKKRCLYFDLGLCPGPCLEKIRNSKSKLKNYLLSLKALKEFLKIYLLKSGRVEGYDISHLSGKFIVGSMVVFEKNEPVKSEYRRFKIKTLKKANDPKALREVILRRLKHSEWKMPSLIVLDGGKAQLKATKKIEIPSVALAKKGRFEGKIYSHFSKNYLLLSELPDEVRNFFLFLRDEAHRFALAYHRLKRKKEL